jgi:hypothetical protein
MTYSGPARTTTSRKPRILVAGLVVVIAAVIGATHGINGGTKHIVDTPRMGQSTSLSMEVEEGVEK